MFGGNLCDYFGRRNVAIFGDLVISLGFVIIILTNAVNLGRLGRGLAGVGSGI
jgi:MFS family permease